MNMNGCVIIDAGCNSMNKKLSTFIIIITLIMPIVYSNKNVGEHRELQSNDDSNGVSRYDHKYYHSHVAGHHGNTKFYPIRKGLRHKNRNRIDKKKYLDPNKKYFDYYPIEKVKMSFDSKEDDKIEVISLMEQEKLENQQNQLKKTHRSKRDLTTTDSKNNNVKNKRHVVGYNYEPPIQALQYYHLQPYQKIPIAGNYYNPISPSGFYNIAVLPQTDIFDNNMPVSIIDRLGDDDDGPMPVWDRTPIRRPNFGNSIQNQNKPTDKPKILSTPPPLIHIAKRPITTETTTASSTTQFSSSDVRPKKPSPPLIHVPTNNRNTDSPTEASPPAKQISQCVWAIVNCCTRGSEKIRYACFREVGCEGSFFDIKPCADSTLKKANSIIDEYYNSSS